MSVIVVGLNHRTVPLPVLESFSIGGSDLVKALHDLAGRDTLCEAVILSTCMRTEIYAEVGRSHAAVGDIRNFLADRSGHPPEAFADHVYDYYDDAAVRHLLRVAAGLDSAVLGEGEILRQVRVAWEVARGEGAARSGLGVIFRQALETGKRARSETAIARGTTSLSHTALSLAGSVGAPLTAVPPDAARCPVLGHGAARVPALPSTAVPSRPSTVVRPSGGEQSGPPCSWAGLLAGRTVLVLGAGEMGAAVAALAAGAPEAGPVVVATRDPARSEELAARIGAEAVPWAQWRKALARADVLLCATAAPGVVVGIADVAEAVATRPDRPLVAVDVAVPRNIDPGVGALDAVTLFDMTDLKAHAEAAIAGRQAEVPKVEALIEEDLERCRKATAHREVAPVLAALHQRADAIRAGEVARAESRLGPLDERQRRAVEAMSRGIVAKLLHEPTVRLKLAAAEERGDTLAASVEELFDL